MIFPFPAGTSRLHGDGKMINLFLKCTSNIRLVWFDYIYHLINGKIFFVRIRILPSPVPASLGGVLSVRGTYKLVDKVMTKSPEALH
jgi:hypothetical protein